MLALLFLAALSTAQTLPPSLQQIQATNNPYITTNYNNQLFLGDTPPDACNIGPTWWCSAPGAVQRCGVANQTIYPCGYDSSYKCAAKKTTVDAWCADPSSNATMFNGGVTGAPAGQFGYLALAMYWAPSSCGPAFPNATGGFCSPYTQPGNKAFTIMQLHGLWPDTGSLYAVEPQAPNFTGQYQGWPQFCDSPTTNYSMCAVTGGMCPWANATEETFKQSDYEDCMRNAEVTECLVPDATIDALKADFEIYAAGYLGSNYTFLDHEWTKHGTCMQGYLLNNITAYFEEALRWAKFMNSPAFPFSFMVAANAGGSVPRADVEAALNMEGVPRCKKNCDLEEVWMCLGRDAAGYPTQFVRCPAGTLASNTCASMGCETIGLPNGGGAPVMTPAAAPMVPSVTPAAAPMVPSVTPAAAPATGVAG